MAKKIVCVEWDDAGFNGGYYDKDDKDIHQPILTETVGHLIKCGKDVVILAMDNFTFGTSPSTQRHISTIPRKMVRKIRYLQEVK